LIDDALVVVPAYNEADVIGETLAELCKVAAHVLVVDDGSNDDTAERAMEEGAEVLRLPINLNYGGALQAGFRYALRKTRLPHAVTFDADGQHDPAYMERVLAPIRQGTADYVLGSRYLEPSGRAHSFSRQAGARLFAAATSAALGKRITDPTTGMTAMTREVARVFLSDLFPQDFPDADVLIMLDRMGFVIQEVPVRMRRSRSGRSMHAGLMRPLYYTLKMSVSMIHLLSRRDLPERRKEARLAA